MKKDEYKEGPQVKEQFERTMTALFKIKKTRLAEKITNKLKKGKD